MVESAEILDETQLGGLAEAAGIEGVKAILEAFWTSTEELAADLCQAVAANDIDNTAKLGHAIKGSSANLGASLMANRATVIETAAKAEDMNQVKTELSQFADDIAKTRQAMDALLARYD
ncbi:MAG: Hpt domain-containing protein [Pseudomonadota bacterium]